MKLRTAWHWLKVGGAALSAVSIAMTINGCQTAQPTNPPAQQQVVAPPPPAAPVAQAPAATVPQTRPVARGPAWPPIGPKLPTLWIIGDSTVRNGADTGNNGQWGWGNPIAAYFDKTKINVQNRAVGGTSSRTFQNTASMWPRVIEAMKPGDYLIMQFGHNDGGQPDEPTRARASLRGNGEDTREIDNPITKQHEVVHSFGWYMRQYVTQAKAKGAVSVIICSPIPRNNWRDGKASRDTTYSVWDQEAAKQTGAIFFPLQDKIATQYETLGQEKVTAELFPDKETTHTDWAGALLNAQIIVDGIKGFDGCDLKNYLLATPPTDLKNPMGKPR